MVPRKGSADSAKNFSGTTQTQLFRREDFHVLSPLLLSERNEQLGVIVSEYFRESFLPETRHVRRVENIEKKTGMNMNMNEDLISQQVRESSEIYDLALSSRRW